MQARLRGPPRCDHTALGGAATQGRTLLPGFPCSGGRLPADDGIQAEGFTIHISRVAPGVRVHEGTDAKKSHGIFNVGVLELSFIVMISKLRWRGPRMPIARILFAVDPIR